MENKRWLMVHDRWSVDNHGGLVVYYWSTMNHDRSSVNDYVRPMVYLRRWVVNNWRSLYNNSILFSSFFVR